MAVEDDKSPAGISGAEPEEVLRAKYLDFCSAQVADILLLLSPDEMFVLAQDASREAGGSESAPGLAAVYVSPATSPSDQPKVPSVTTGRIRADTTST